MTEINEFFANLFVLNSAEKITGDELPGGNTTETKKCLRCLKRTALHFVRCPYCNSDNFLYN